MKHSRDVQFLTKQYKTGPAENPSGKEEPYLSYLNKQLAERTENFKKAVADAESKHKEWVSVAK